MSRFFQVYDCELSTSKVGQGDILSLGCAIGCTETLELVDTITLYGRPRDINHWNWKAEETHGISKKEAMSFPSQKEMVLSLMHFLKDYKSPDDEPLPFVTHSNNWVDYRFLKEIFTHFGWENSFYKVAPKTENDVIRSTFVFREYLSYQDLPTNKINLRVMADHFGIDLKHHDVESDTKACFEGVVQLIKHFKDCMIPPSGTAKISFDSFNELVNRHQKLSQGNPQLFM